MYTCWAQSADSHHPRIFLRKPRTLALLRKPSDRAECLRKPRPRVAVFYVFSTLPASGRFASEGSFVPFLVCFRARYYCTLHSWASRNKEPRLLSSRNSRTHTCNQERYAAALATGKSPLACEDQTKVWRKLVSMRGYREERSLQTRHGIRGLFAQS